MERLKRTRIENAIYIVRWRLLVTFGKIALVEGVGAALKESWGKGKPYGDHPLKSWVVINKQRRYLAWFVWQWVDGGFSLTISSINLYKLFQIYNLSKSSAGSSEKPSAHSSNKNSVIKSSIEILELSLLRNNLNLLV